MQASWGQKAVAGRLSSTALVGCRQKDQLQHRDDGGEDGMRWKDDDSEVF